MTTSEIRDAMHKHLRVRYRGIEYERITAHTYRLIDTHKTGVYRAVYQLELKSCAGNSVTVANPDEVETVKAFEAEEA